MPDPQLHRAGERDPPRVVRGARAGDRDGGLGGVHDERAQRREHGDHRVGVIVQQARPVAGDGAERVGEQVRQVDGRNGREARGRGEPQHRADRVRERAERVEQRAGDVGEHGARGLREGIGGRQVEHGVRVAADVHDLGGEPQPRRAPTRQ